MRPACPRSYIFHAFGYTLDKSLHQESIGKWIPGALSFHDGDVICHSPSRARFCLVDMSEAIRRSPFCEQRAIHIGVYIRCLRWLILTLHKAEKHGSVERHFGRLLDSLRERHASNWSRVLVEFACLVDLLGVKLLCGEDALRRQFSCFIVRHRHEISQRAPLAVSLQFVTLCLPEDFEKVMRKLMAELPVHQYDELIACRGNISLFLTGRPSSTILRFIRHHRRGRSDLERDGSRGREVASSSRPSRHLGEGRLLSPQRLIDRGFTLVDVIDFGGKIVFPEDERKRRSRSSRGRNIRTLDHLDHSDLYS